MKKETDGLLCRELQEESNKLLKTLFLIDSNIMSLRKLNLNSLKNKAHLEILAARGRLRNYKKEINVFSCYIPPKLTRQQSTEFLDTLSDAIAECKMSSEGWFVIGGDWNNRSLVDILDVYPDLKRIETPPTRKNNVLDILLSNIGQYVRNKQVCAPIEGEFGQVSDHKMVLIEAMLPRPRAFSWETHEYLEITRSGSDLFKTRLAEEKWLAVHDSWPDVDRMTAQFQMILETHIHACFRWRRVRRRNTDKPWISDALRRRMKRRKAVFWQEGRSETWKRLDKGIKKTIAFRKKQYEEKMTKKLESCGKSGQWYSIYRFLDSDDMPSRWNISELEPNQSPSQLADTLAAHFVRITNQSNPLSPTDIPTSLTGAGLIPQLDLKGVTKFIRQFKKCTSRVNGDIPRELVNPCAEDLARALTPIYNACFLTKKWPSLWKIETIVPIPKTISPGSLDDIRPISMTTLWSKMLETYLARFTMEETKDNWSHNQYGGRKGASTDHVLIEVWDRILSGLEHNKAVVLAGIDFSKSFSRCSYQQILEAYTKLGLSDWGLQMHAAFLMNRKMRVKIGNVLSNELPVTGGAVQGSVLDVMDHNAVMEFVDENVEGDFFKYVDDLTMAEAIPMDTDCLIDNSPSRQLHSFKPKQIQAGFDSLNENCQTKGLLINGKKTQLLSVSSSKFDTQAWISLQDGSPMYSSDSLKLLGFEFGRKPTVHAQIDNLVSRAASRTFVIRRLAGVKVNKTRLKNIYCSIVRSVMEYSCVTYGPMMAQYEKNRLEKIQRNCLRSIYGFNKSYAELLDESGLQTLEERRKRALGRFAVKAAANKQFTNWFPLNDNRFSQRSSNLYKELYAKSDRLYRSPLFEMRRFLNNNEKTSRVSTEDYLDLSNLFNLP